MMCEQFKKSHGDLTVGGKEHQAALISFGMTIGVLVQMKECTSTEVSKLCAELDKQNDQLIKVVKEHFPT